jgi:hypothetical protein
MYEHPRSCDVNSDANSWYSPVNRNYGDLRGRRLNSGLVLLLVITQGKVSWTHLNF